MPLTCTSAWHVSDAVSAGTAASKVFGESGALRDAGSLAEYCCQTDIIVEGNSAEG